MFVFVVKLWLLFDSITLLYFSWKMTFLFLIDFVYFVISAPPFSLKTNKRPGALNRGNTVCQILSKNQIQNSLSVFKFKRNKEQILFSFFKLFFNMEKRKTNVITFRLFFTWYNSKNKQLQLLVLLCCLADTNLRAKQNYSFQPVVHPKTDIFYFKKNT